MKLLLTLFILASFISTGEAKEITLPSLSNQADSACFLGQQQSYKLIPVDTESDLVSPEVWEVYNQVVTEHVENKDIIYPEKGRQQLPESCHNLVMRKLDTLDLDFE